VVRFRPVNRWDRLLEQKPIPLREHLLDEAARLLAAELARWPLPIGELDPATGRCFEPLLMGESPRPRPEVYSQATRLARWDLDRQTEAGDDYFKNRRYLEAGVPDADRPALLMISRWLVEQLLALGDATQGRIRRAEMLAVLDRLARLGPAGAAPDAPPAS